MEIRTHLAVRPTRACTHKRGNAPNSFMFRKDGTGQRAARSLRVSTRGTARGAFVRSSKNGVGRPSRRTRQPSILDARRAKTPNDGGSGAFGGSGPTADLS